MNPLVVSYGESLVDFLPDRAGVTLRHVDSFRKSIGGAPANVAVGLARLRCNVAMIGKVGDDEFGHFLRDALAAEGVDVGAVRLTSEGKTGITFISLDEHGDRRFLFFRESSAETTMRAEDVDGSVIERATVFIAGSNLLVTEGSREATWFALDYARRNDTFIVLDPNVRLHLWDDHDLARDHVRRELGYGDVMKLNEEELAFLRPDLDAAALWAELRHDGDPTALVITRAEQGAEVFWRDGHTSVAAPACAVLDTTGAGDGFVAGMVCGLLAADSGAGADALRSVVRDFSERDWQRTLRLGCHVGTDVCRALGATPGLPHIQSIPWSDLGFES